MARRDRWAYMKRDDYNPPCDACPECKTPSKVYSQGNKTEDGWFLAFWQCEHRHQWISPEPR